MEKVSKTSLKLVNFCKKLTACYLLFDGLFLTSRKEAHFIQTIFILLNKEHKLCAELLGRLPSVMLLKF